MIKIAAKPTFTTAVRFSAPGESGRLEKLTFDATYHYLPRADYDKLMQEARDEGQKGGDGDQLILDKVLVGWIGVTGADGTELAFSADAVAQLCNTYMAAKAGIVVAWVNAQLGVEQGN